MCVSIMCVNIVATFSKGINVCRVQVHSKCASRNSYACEESIIILLKVPIAKIQSGMQRCRTRLTNDADRLNGNIHRINVDA